MNAKIVINLTTYKGTYSHRYSFDAIHICSFTDPEDIRTLEHKINEHIIYSSQLSISDHGVVQESCIDNYIMLINQILFVNGIKFYNIEKIYRIIHNFHKSMKYAFKDRMFDISVTIFHTNPKFQQITY